MPCASTWKVIRGLGTSFSTTAASLSTHIPYLKAVNRPDVHLHHQKGLRNIGVDFELATGIFVVCGLLDGLAAERLQLTATAYFRVSLTVA